MRVFAVVVTHRGPSAMLERCLKSLTDGGGLDAVLVVDNSGRPRVSGSIDASATDSSATDASATDPSATNSSAIDSAVSVLRVENRGFGAAVNAGVDLLCDSFGRDSFGRDSFGRDSFGCDDDSLIAILNDDIEVSAGWLKPLTEMFDTGGDTGSSIGAVQPKLLLAGTDPLQVNSVGVQLDQAGAGVDIGYGEIDGPEWQDLRQIDMFTGGAVVVRSGFFRELAGFDERYFLYYEDVDLARRGAEQGWTYMCEPASTVRHRPGSTTAALGHKRRYLQERNRIWIAGRFGSSNELGRALWLSVRRVRHAPHVVHLRALAAGVGGLPRLWMARLRAGRNS